MATRIPSRTLLTPRVTPRATPRATLAWLAVVRAYNLCDAVLTTRLAALGLRLGEHEVLANLAAGPGITQQELAARCFVAKSSVSMLLTQMEAQKLVRRDVDAADARVRRLFLTPAGQKLAQRTLQIQSEVLSAMAAPVSTAELDALTDVMQRVSAQLEALRDANQQRERALSRASAPRSRPPAPARRG